LAIEEVIKNRIDQLINESRDLARGDEHGQAYSEQQCQECSAWLAAAQNCVHLICENPSSPYRIRADRISGRDHGWAVNGAVGEMAAVMRNLLLDAEAGLLASVADQARAEAFDDFLDHADAYLANKQKNEAGVIAGVVFEDTIRRLSRKNNINEKDVKLDALISELANLNEISAIKAKRARAAAHVRTKASHAQWDEFELDDVNATIEFTRELISTKIDG
jgi:predicted nucleic acid-binding protein